MENSLDPLEQLKSEGKQVGIAGDSTPDYYEKKDDQLWSQKKGESLDDLKERAAEDEG